MVINPPAKILIVDDEPFNVDYLEQELEDLGYQTVSAFNGPEALEKVTVEAPDLILLDVMMPGMDGFTVCRVLKEMEETQLIPVVIMTALGTQEDRIKGIESGADDFLTKPVDRRELFARIQTAVKMKRAVDRKLQDLETEESKQVLVSPPVKKDQPPVVQQTGLDKVFYREGEYWTVAYQGEVSRVRDTMGLRYLAYLLRYPHRQIHVLDLVTAVECPPRNSSGVADNQGISALASENLRVRASLGDAGVVLDSQAKAAYKHRLYELQGELEEAETRNDLGRSEKIQQEIEFLTQELLSGVGFGGRDRRAASSVERARINVTRAIKTALQKLSLHHPSLGAYLVSTIHTGTCCSYTPDLHIPSPWKL